MRKSLEYYVTGVIESSNRTRRVLFVTTLVSGLLLIGFFNSWPGNHLNREIWIAERALQLYPFEGEASGVSLEVFAQAKGFWEAHKERFPTEGELREHVNLLKKVQLEKSHVLHVPIFGIAFHVRDLGLVGGVSLALLLVVLLFCLAREVANIEIAMKQSRTSDVMAAMYEILAMRQVLIIPGRDSSVHSSYWSWLPMVLFFLPVTVQGWVLVFETISLRAPEVPQYGTAFRYGLNIGFFVLIATLSASSIRLSRTISAAWKKWEHAVERFKDRDLVGRWDYRMTSANGDHQHRGHCRIQRPRGEGRLKLNGVRTETKEGLNTASPTVDSFETHWRSVWAVSTENGALRFEYSINVGKDTICGYCDLQAQDAGYDHLQGSYYVLSPPDKRMHGTISFTRSQEGAHT